MALYRRTVLVVDDEPLIRLALLETLEAEGFDVLEAGNVLEAIAAISNCEAIGAVVTDIDMPGALNGLDLMRLVVGCNLGISVIVTSGGHRQDCISLPPDCRFIAKPYPFSMIVDHLRSRLAQGVNNTHLQDQDFRSVFKF